MKETITLYKSGDHNLMDISHVIGLTIVKNIKEDVFKKHYKKIECSEFWKWNRKRKRGFYYEPNYLKQLRWLIQQFFWIDDEEITIYVPKKTMMPLLIKHKNFFFMQAPRLSTCDQRLSYEFRRQLAQKYDVKLPEDIEREHPPFIYLET